MDGLLKPFKINSGRFWLKPSGINYRRFEKTVQNWFWTVCAKLSRIANGLAQILHTWISDPFSWMVWNCLEKTAWTFFQTVFSKFWTVWNRPEFLIFFFFLGSEFWVSKRLKFPLERSRPSFLEHFCLSENIFIFLAISPFWACKKPY